MWERQRISKHPAGKGEKISVSTQSSSLHHCWLELQVTDFKSNITFAQIEQNAQWDSTESKKEKIVTACVTSVSLFSVWYQDTYWHTRT